MSFIRRVLFQRIPIHTSALHVHFDTTLPPHLSLLLADQPHRTPHNRPKQIRNIECLNDRLDRPNRRCPVALLIRLRRECKEHENGKDGHLTGENQRGEAVVDVVVSHVLVRGEGAVAREDVDHELL